MGLSQYLSDATGKPEVWIAALSLLGSALVYMRFRSERADRNVERRNQFTAQDWDRMRALIDEAREEREQLRKEAQLTRDLVEQIKTREAAIAASEFRLQNENASLIRRVEELELAMKKCHETLTKYETWRIANGGS
jgi:septal ring factor EnvC (AmiA/AmiB activator)